MPIGNLNANLNLLSDYVNDMHNTLGYRMCMIAFGATYIDIEGHMKMKWNVCSLCDNMKQRCFEQKLFVYA